MSILRVVGVFLMIASMSCSAYAEKGDLSAQIKRIINKHLPTATVGIVVADANTGNVLYEFNADKPLAPASNTKLFLSAAALYYLKPHYHYATGFYANHKIKKNGQLRGNLYLRFTGDPSLTVKDLDKLIDTLAKEGLKDIRGDLVIDGSRFRKPYYPSGNSFDDLHWYYSAPITSIILNENSLDLKFRVHDRHLSIKPKKFARYFPISHRVELVPREKALTECNLNVEMNAKNHIDFYGCWPQLRHHALERVAIHNPFHFAKQVLRTKLAKHNIKLRGTIVLGQLPQHHKTLAVHYSPRLKDLVRHLLHDSDNLYANSILKTLGYEFCGRGTFKAGIKAVRQILVEHTTVDLSAVKLSDGAGSRYNLIPPRQIINLLASIYSDPVMRRQMLYALPSPGEKGSLSERLPGFHLRHQLYAKTGTMHDMSALSGYVYSSERKPLIFAIVINNVLGKIDIAKRAEDRICRLLIHISTMPNSFNSVKR